MSARGISNDDREAFRVAADGLRAATGNGYANAAVTGYDVTLDPKGKLVLPELPCKDDTVALCAWLMCAFNLDRSHPVTPARHLGNRGPDGHVMLDRTGAEPICFEPVTRINTPGKLIETLSWYLLPEDGAVHAFNAGHCRDISYVVRMLCGAYEAISEAEEAEGIVANLIQQGEPVEGCTTHGTSAQRYEAAINLGPLRDQAIGRAIGAPRCLIDTGAVNKRPGEIVDEGEIVLRVSDLREAARRHVGSSLPRGWLEARMDALGWRRITLQGYGHPGRAGERGPHARVFAYVGHLPASDQ